MFTSLVNSHQQTYGPLFLFTYMVRGKTTLDGSRCHALANSTEFPVMMVTFYIRNSSKQLTLIIKLDMTSVTSDDMERFKGLDMSCKRWEEEDLDDLSMSMELWEVVLDLKDAIFFVDIGRENLAYYIPRVASKLGGYIHIRDTAILYSYHVKEKTISLSHMPSLVLPASNVCLWECSLQDDHGGPNFTFDSIQEDSEIVVRSVIENETVTTESSLLNLPFDILEVIMDNCISVEYLNFRATCKRCKVAAPLIQWGNKTSLARLKAYSLVSPWLMVAGENQGIITFTDPMLGDTYLMKKRFISLQEEEIYCSLFGWLLFFCSDMQCLMFYNPFTCGSHVLPDTDYSLIAACFSSPPTSPDCMVAGFSNGAECHVLIHYVAREQSWRAIRVGAEPDPIRFLTLFGQDLYALDGDGKLIVFKDLGKEDHSLKMIESAAAVPLSCGTSPTRHYLMKRDQNLLKVIVGKFGESVELFQWDVSKHVWEKIDTLGNYMVYICGGTCVCVEAKIPEMHNKIYFPILHSKNKKIMYYSLESCTFQTFNGENFQQLEDFFGTTYHLAPHAWIEPCWS